MGKLDKFIDYIGRTCSLSTSIPFNKLLAIFYETEDDNTLDLNLSANDFNDIALCLEACGYKMMAQNYGCDDGDYVEVLDEDRDPEIFNPNDYIWQVWR